MDDHIWKKQEKNSKEPFEIKVDNKIFKFDINYIIAHDQNLYICEICKMENFEGQTPSETCAERATRQLLEK